MYMRRVHESGQILLITLLVLSVAMTISLGLIGRTTTDVNITNQLEESSKAFHAAEAGIEAALLSGSVIPVILSGDASYTVTKQSIGGAAGVYTLPHVTLKGNTETIWLVTHNTDGTINESQHYEDSNTAIGVCWSRGIAIPAIVASIVYKEGSGVDAGTFKVARGAFDPDNTRRSSNEFGSATTGSGCGLPNNYSITINFSSDFGIDSDDIPYMLRVRPVYGDTTISVMPLGAATLPIQAYQYDVVGKTGSGVTRKVQATQYYPSGSSLFDHAIYSQTDFSY